MDHHCPWVDRCIGLENQRSGAQGAQQPPRDPMGGQQGSRSWVMNLWLFGKFWEGDGLGVRDEVVLCLSDPFGFGLHALPSDEHQLFGRGREILQRWSRWLSRLVISTTRFNKRCVVSDYDNYAFQHGCACVWENTMQQQNWDWTLRNNWASNVDSYGSNI